MKIVLEFRNVVLGYGGKPLLPPLDLALSAGDFLGIVGPNGAGKTTVLKALLGILKTLSGGQRQRILIAMALVANPGILVLDEPTKGMDILGESSIMEIVVRLNRQGLTVIMVSHLLSLVARHARSIMLIDHDIHCRPADEIFTEKMLTRVYGSPVRITSDSHRGRIIYIAPPGKEHDNAGNV